MILESKENAVTYRCPVCGGHVLSMMGVFKLSGDLIKLKCACGGSEMTITRQGSDKIKLELPCLFCEDRHSYLIDRKQFFSQTAFSLTCRMTGLETCCIGDESAVRDYTEAQDEKLQAILRDCGYESLEDYLMRTAAARLLPEEEEEDEEDEVLIDEGEVIAAADFILSELSEEGRLHCGCEEGEGDYAYAYQDGVLQIFCRTCSAETEIAMRTGADLRALIEIDEIELEKIPVISLDNLPDPEDD